MSSMIKKKGLLGKTFKPKAPQARRPAPAPASASTRPSTETTSKPQTQTPAPTATAEASNPQSAQTPSLNDHISTQPSEDVDSPGQTQIISTPAVVAHAESPPPIESSLKRSAAADTADAHNDDTLEPPAKKVRTTQAPPDQTQSNDSQSSVLHPSATIIHTSADQPTPQLGASIESEAQSAEISAEHEATIRNDSNIAESDEISQQAETAVPDASPANTTTEHPEKSITSVPVNELRDPITRESTEDAQAEADLSGMGPGQASRGSHTVPSAALNPDGTSGASLEEPKVAAVKTKKKAVSKRRKIQPQEGERATIEIQLHKPKRATGGKGARKKQDSDKKKQRRAKTPEGAEEESLPAGITMGDLCKDLRIGKKFSKHDEIRQKDHQKRIKARLAKTMPDMAEGEPAGDEATSSAPPRQGAAAEEQGTSQRANETVQLKIVNGQIVVDESSLRHDMHVRSNNTEEVVEENDFTRLLTSGTYMKRERAQAWSPSDTDLFYKCLRSYGTDFEMIAPHFPGRSRRTIKLKFNAEEKVNGARINRTLMGTPEPIDINEHQARAGFEYEEVEDIEAQAREKEEAHQAEQQKELDKQAEAIRKKKEEITRSGGQGGAEDASKENEGAVGEASAAPRSKKKGVTKKPNKHVYGANGGGEEVEIVGTVER
ncbi:myb-like DNA-binding domain-containing protein [Phlyctema vagabunda]|uniref:Myb-like DNA-binding domain-containing protein n=1 Tax=Phlyctema vagabunda TaxID=108571 RepID=A0ABR4P897_9HELO